MSTTVAASSTLDRRARAVWPAALLSGALLAVLFVAAGCASESTESAEVPSEPIQASDSMKKAEISDEVTATALVVAVDPATRRIVLKGETGRGFDVYAGDAVRNFAQIHVGDTLKVRYKRMLAVQLLPPGSDAMQAGGGVVAGRAPLGGKPAGGIGGAISVRVTVVSVDLAAEIVNFTLPSGELIAHRIATPEGLEFAQGLEPGDLVQIDYAEALAVSIDKLPPTR